MNDFRGDESLFVGIMKCIVASVHMGLLAMGTGTVMIWLLWGLP